MISNERPSPYGRGNNGNSWHQPSQHNPNYNSNYNQNPNYNPNYNPNWQPKAPVREDSLKSGQIQIERKNFIFSLKENPRGRLLRITEDIAGRHNSIIIPATGLHEFKKLLEEMIKASDETPQSNQPPA
ncbi:MAG TPA: RNA-binding protein [Verrucomicrobiae bacterium]|nr:RNA-binding protein [Verrucomicrobiae bacterium]